MAVPLKEKGLEIDQKKAAKAADTFKKTHLCKRNALGYRCGIV